MRDIATAHVEVRTGAMTQQRILQFVFPVVAALMTSALACAQSLPTEVGGSAGREMNRIRNQSVGTGYSVGSLNAISLRNAQAQIPNVGQTTTRPSARIGLGVGGSPAGKPFTSFSPSPTVSPYLNLFREDFDGNSDFNYNTLVRPMLQQEQFNQQMQRQSMEISRRLQTIAAQADFNPQGSTTQYPTGHQTVFMYYGHYYPSAGRQRR